MNPQTGEVLAMVSLPTYDNNLFATGISNADYQALLKDPAGRWSTTRSATNTRRARPTSSSPAPAVSATAS